MQGRRMHNENDSLREEVLRSYLDLTPEQIRQQLVAIVAREIPAPGHRQVPFNAVETLLCYGLFYLLDPHRYGGGNIDQVPSIVNTLARFFKRSPGSLTSKMLNLDGSRPHGKSLEPLLFAILAAEPERFRALYQMILTAARQLDLDEDTLPDFLADPALAPAQEDLLGQEEIPASTSQLLIGVQPEMENLERAFRLGERLTEKLVERKIRLAQHRFALRCCAIVGATASSVALSRVRCPSRAVCCAPPISSPGRWRLPKNGWMCATGWRPVRRMMPPSIRAILPSMAAIAFTGRACWSRAWSKIRACRIISARSSPRTCYCLSRRNDPLYAT